MNIFVVNEDPSEAAVSLCDKHVPKMIVETTQMLVSALRRHGAGDEQVPLTKAGTPHKGGYRHHPATVWTGDSRGNAEWLLEHGFALCDEFQFRFNKEHACLQQLEKISLELDLIPEGDMTDVALCVGEEFQNGTTHAPIEDAVPIYREFYRYDKSEFAKWEKDRPAPEWWSYA